MNSTKLPRSLNLFKLTGYLALAVSFSSVASVVCLKLNSPKNQDFYYSEREVRQSAPLAIIVNDNSQEVYLSLQENNSIEGWHLERNPQYSSEGLQVFTRDANLNKSQSQKIENLVESFRSSEQNR